MTDPAGAGIYIYANIGDILMVNVIFTYKTGSFLRSTTNPMTDPAGAGIYIYMLT